MARTGIQTGAIIARSKNKTINKVRSMETPLASRFGTRASLPLLLGRPEMGCNVALLATSVGLASIIGWQLTALSPLIAPPRSDRAGAAGHSVSPNQFCSGRSPNRFGHVGPFPSGRRLVRPFAPGRDVGERRRSVAKLPSRLSRVRCSDCLGRLFAAERDPKNEQGQAYCQTAIRCCMVDLSLGRPHSEMRPLAVPKPQSDWRGDRAK